MKSISLVLLSIGLSIGLMNCRPKQNDDKLSTDLVDIGSSGTGAAPAGKAPIMTFETERHDFGKITQGERVTYAFKFKNTGGSPLIISDAHGSCGCTIPQYPKDPIPAGGEGVINVEFNSEGKRSKQEKQVTMVTNCEPNTKVIYITADVLTPDTETK